MAARNYTRWADSTVAGFPPRSKPYKVRESNPDLPGFCLQITPAGSRTFMLQYQTPEGRRPFIKLGRTEEITLRQARKLARQTLDDIEDGGNPAKDREEQKQRTRVAKARKQEGVEAASGSVAELFTWYHKKLEEEGAASLPEVKASYRRNIASFIGNKSPAEVTREDCLDIISACVDRGALSVARNVKLQMSAAFGFGLNAQGDPAWKRRVPDYQMQFNPARDINLASVEKLKAARKLKQERAGTVPQGKRSLSEVEIAMLWQRIDNPGELSKELALATKLLLGTGQRVREVLEATWSEFDLIKREWVIPASRRKTRQKVGIDHLVPLADLHIELLQQVKELNPHGKYLFPKVDGSGPRPYRGFTQAIDRFCHPTAKSKRQPFEHFSPRDLRRTVKSNMAGGPKLPHEIRNKLQGHAMSGLDRNYNTYDYQDEKREAMAQWVTWLESAVNRTMGEVVAP